MLKEAQKIIAPILVLALGIVGFKVFGKQQKPPQAPQAEPEAELVDVMLVEDYNGKIEIEFDGLVIPYRRVNLSAEIAGRITDKCDRGLEGKSNNDSDTLAASKDQDCGEDSSSPGTASMQSENQEPCCPESQEIQEGRMVEKGHQLLTIDREFYELERDRLNAEKEQTEAAGEVIREQIESTKKLVAIAEEQRQLEEANQQRAERLLKRGAITQAEYETNRKNYLTVLNSLTNLENQLSQLQKQKLQNEKAVDIAAAKLNQAKRDLELSVVKAPITGLIVEDHVEPGDYVQRGSPLFLIEDVSQVEISSNLKMEDFAWLTQASASSLPQYESAGFAASVAEAYQLPNHPVTVSYKLAGSVYEWEGRISRLAGTGLDPKTRMVPCRVTVPKPQNITRVGDSRRLISRSPRTLMNGMFVQLSMEVDTPVDLLALPEKAVRPGNAVWFVDENKQLQSARIEVVHRQNGRVLINKKNSPLRANQAVIVSQLAEPQEGMNLKVKDSAKKSTKEETL